MCCEYIYVEYWLYIQCTLNMIYVLKINGLCDYI